MKCRRHFFTIEQGFQHAGSVDYWDTIAGKRKHSDAIVIDAGAYKGDAVRKLIKNAGGQIKTYFAFEPAEENFQILKANKFEEIDMFIPKKAALGKECAMINFYYDENDPAASSCLIESTESMEKVEMITIDSLELNEEADYFIKMDIEGNELDALEGGKKLIQEKKPNLAICLYHKQRDLIEIPQYLKRLVPDYDFYLVGGSHTILIAK